MATVRDRGQIILVAAFALAVIFIAMALIVNSAIFTQNLASRGDTSGSSEALSMRAMVEENAGENLKEVNRRSGASSDMRGRIDDEMSKQIGRQEARNGRLVNMSYEDSESGTRIYEDDPSDSLAPSGFSINDVDTDNPGVGGEARSLRIDVTDIDTSTTSLFVTAAGTNNWEAEISNPSGNTIEITTTVTTGSTRTETCSIVVDDINQFEIDITEGTVDEKPCSALRRTGDGENFAFAADVSAPYDITFVGTSAVEGEFSVIVDNYDDISSSGDVQEDTALYSVTLEYGYSTSDLTYVTDIRVAPGEPDV